MRRLFPYYGAKHQHARHYPSPYHELVIEPFAGSAGYATHHAHPSRRVLLIDRDPAVCATWRYLIRVSPAELLTLPDVPMDGTVDDVRLTPEQRCLVGWWLQHGRTTPATRPSSWARSGARPLSYWGPGVREKLAAQVEHIRHWQIMEADYMESPDAIATWFVDPPYQVAGRHYRYGSQAIDYAALGSWCRSRIGQLMVCENAGATWLPFEPLGSLRASPGGGRKGRTEEVLYIGRRGPLREAVRGIAR